MFYLVAVAPKKKTSLLPLWPLPSPLPALLSNHPHTPLLRRIRPLPRSEPTPSRSKDKTATEPIMSIEAYTLPINHKAQIEREREKGAKKMK
jgi:hypothetical protein